SLNINNNEYNKIMIWMPTFRHHKNGSRSDVGNFVTKGDLPIIENKHSWKSLNSYLRKYNMMLIIKPHPAQSIQWFSAENNTNIRTVTNDDLFAHSIELYNLLGECDALITDYSSVYLDYLLLNKPVAFTTDDINEYRNNLGFLVDNIYDYMPGHKINNIEDFKIFIYDLANSIDKYEIKRLEVRKKFNKHLDGKSSERILRYLNLIK
ncbi:MAG: CDP-glycerol glycerophosphotransferase family protein, partial [Staphylococcus equorum]|nr:CDP-glycerol glycerophosphotransferase family protein [Staphylococcus equorum]